MVAPIESEIESILSNLTIEEKVSLLSGKDFWRTQEIPSKGVATIKVTDGPSGARGGQSVDGCKAAFFPSGVSMAATFDIETIRRAGKTIAQDVLAKQASVLLAPTTCIHRSPLGGRNFESYSEDPFLSGKLTANFVDGVQSQQVAATLKHFVANEQETTRHSVDEEIDERTLREIYLLPFEIAVKESDPWCMMTSYNCINGQHADANEFTLKKVLREEWKYKGLVMSDWGGTNSTTDSVLASLDLEMPGPTHRRGDMLVAEAKKRSDVQKAIDNSVRRMLNLIFRVGKWKDFSPELPEESNPREEDCKFIRSVADDGIVMLKNADVLPIAKEPRSILVVGPNADKEVASGGGSAGLAAYYMTNPLQSIKDRFKSSKVTFEQGCSLYKFTQLLSGERACTDSNGQPGATLTFYTDVSRSTIVKSTNASTGFVFPIDTLPEELIGKKSAATYTTNFTPAVTGTYTFGLCSIGPATLFIDGKEVLILPAGTPRGELMFTMCSIERTTDVTLQGSQTYALEVVAHTPSKADLEGPLAENEGLAFRPGIRLGCTLQEDVDAKIASAVEQAKSAEYVIAVTGLNDEFEGEGFDMHDTQMVLPGLQNRLISEIAKVNKNVIVCNQSGVPIAMPWIADVGAVLQCWYQGMEMGNAIADVISGDVNPSGKLPVTFPKTIEDSPCYNNFGLKHKVQYSEGIYVGYRHFDAKAIEPLFPFGFGLSYTSFKYAGLSLDTDMLKQDSLIRGSFELSNTGKIDGKESFQVYVEPKSPTFSDRPLRELKAFGKLTLAAGASKTAEFSLDTRAVSRYDVEKAAWIADKGDYVVRVGSSSRDLHLSASFTVKETFVVLSTSTA